jgi:E3 ubiquitin-protein ligase UBR7
VNSTTGQKGDVTGEEPAKGNKYNHNFRNIFCGCREEYDPHTERGTMFQCLGLGTAEDGGCGEDWWHPECVVGLSREEYRKSIEKPKAKEAEGMASKALTGITKEVSVTFSEEDLNGHAEHSETRRPSIVTAIAAGLANGNNADGNDVAADLEQEDDDPPLPPGFPEEDDFDTFICHKCVEAHPWIKRYAGTEGFLPPVYLDATLNATKASEPSAPAEDASNVTGGESKKRKASDDEDNERSTAGSMAPPKRQKSEDPVSTLKTISETTILPITPKKQASSICKVDALPAAPTSSTPFSLFLKPDFRDHLCHCPAHYSLLKPHTQLLEEEETYEPPVSESEHNADGSVGTGSIYDKGEAAFSTMDRMQAIQGAMAYAHLKDGLKAFLQPFAESGQAVGAEDIKTYFEKLRGDAEGIKEAKQNAEEDGSGDNRREQSGY